MGRPVFRLSAIVAAAGAALFLPLLAAGVAADTKGPCTAGFAKPGWALTNTDSLDTPGSAFQVNKDEKVEAGMFSPFGGGAFTYHRVQLEFAGFRWTVSEKLDSGTDTEWRETVNVNDYAAFGVGLYKVIGYGRLAGGQDCIGTAYVKVTGRNPLRTAPEGPPPGGGGGAAPPGGGGRGPRPLAPPLWGWWRWLPPAQQAPAPRSLRKRWWIRSKRSQGKRRPRRSWRRRASAPRSCGRLLSIGSRCSEWYFAPWRRSRPFFLQAWP